MFDWKDLNRKALLSFLASIFHFIELQKKLFLKLKHILNEVLQQMEKITLFFFRKY